MIPTSEPPAVRAEAAARRLLDKGLKPQVALILGSGLSGVVDSIQTEFTGSTGDLLGSRSGSVAGHSGKFVIGSLGGIRLVAFLGRIHLYEGYSAEEQTLPILLASRLGARLLLLTNASGGINPAFKAGDLMVISDQINLTGRVVVPARSDRSRRGFQVYDPSLSELLRGIARDAELPVHTGVYAGGLGPSYETAAEIKMLRRIGADAVGMSTVLEALAGRRLGMKVAGISVITNMATGISSTRLSHDEVTAGAAAAGEHMRKILSEFLQGIADSIE